MADCEKLLAILEEKFGARREEADHQGLTVVVDRENLHDLMLFLRDDQSAKFDMLLDIVGIDYQGFKDYEGSRFAVEYVLKTMKAPVKRMRVKVFVSEADCNVPSIHDLYAIANWQEREVFDQYGVVFKGHPDLRRLLNHAEFEGHPLRKDYPAHKRQWLSTNDYLLPELEARLEKKGYRIVSRSKEVLPNDGEYLEGSCKV